VKEEQENYIYTDTYYTKKQILDSHNGFLEHYSQYRMYVEIYKMENTINRAGLVRYINSLYTLIKYHLHKFPKRFTKEEINKIERITKKTDQNLKDFEYLNDVFMHFMVDSKIMDIVMAEEDLSKSVEKNR